MNKKKVLIVMLVFVSVILMGCKGKGASSADGVSDAARAVIDAFMTCPNEDLYNDKMKGQSALAQKQFQMRKGKKSMQNMKE